MRLRGFVVTLLLFCLSPLFALQASSGFFLDANQIEKVDNPAQWVGSQFVLRQGDKEWAYFRVPMSDLLFRSKKRFSLPVSLDVSQRIALPLFATPADAAADKPIAEALLNDRMVLVDADSLFARFPDGNLQRLGTANSIGVHLLRAVPGTLAASKPLPAFFYTVKGHTSWILVSKPGEFPVEVRPLAPEGGYAETVVATKAVPAFRPMSALPVLAVNQGSDGHVDPQALDSLIAVHDRARLDLENEFSSYARLLDSLLYKVDTVGAADSSADVAKRLLVRDSVLQSLLKDELVTSAYSSAIRELDGRKLLLASYKSQVASERDWRDRGARRVLLREKVWNRVFARAYGGLGRNMPDWSCDPGTDGLWALGGSLALDYPLNDFLALEARGSLLYSRWHFNEDVDLVSSQKRAEFATLLAWPLAVSIQNAAPGKVSGVVVQVVAGPSVALARTGVNGKKYVRKTEFSAGGVAGLQVHFTALPVMLEGLYSYASDGFGDLGVVIALPLTGPLFKD